MPSGLKMAPLGKNCRQLNASGVNEVMFHIKRISLLQQLFLENRPHTQKTKIRPREKQPQSLQTIKQSTKTSFNCDWYLLMILSHSHQIKRPNQGAKNLSSTSANYFSKPLGFNKGTLNKKQTFLMVHLQRKNTVLRKLH